MVKPIDPAMLARIMNDARAISRPAPFDPAKRVPMSVYRPNERNHCPGCGREHWYVGRATAECAFCGTALPLAGQ